MPYIQATDRALILAGHPPDTPGELNFLFSWLAITEANSRQTDLVAKWQNAARRYIQTKGLSYQTINDVMGVFASVGWELCRRVDGAAASSVARQLKALLEVAAEDFYVRFAGPYEDGKIIANGDLPYASL